MLARRCGVRTEYASRLAGYPSPDGRRRLPDIVYLDPSRVSAISHRGVEGAPTLLAEVLSPGTTLIDRRTKPQLYARHGVPYFWLVDPEGRSVEAFVLGPQGYSPAVRASGNEPVSPPPFPDLSLIPATLWG